jgi:hypothetical protein
LALRQTPRALQQPLRIAVRRHLDPQAVDQRTVFTARAGRPATLVNSTTSSSRAPASTRLKFSCASHSSVSG